ncbi:kinesin-like protein KIN-12A [Canna indica]|uniref:Kinesin-like protein KIN-12A n=1 Tax=Canna indica TaxID=4628 RepID=A0AAQ3QIZ3_9LILI|nr:kinesin-like protein KIN-12A [Canna indica]
MKAFTTPRGGRAPPSESPVSHKQRPPRIPKENVDPCSAPVDRSPFRSPATAGKPLSVKNRSPVLPRPPVPSKPAPNSLKRKLSLESHSENGGSPSSVSDSGVQVIVRMRPPSKQSEEADLVVQKVSASSVSIVDHTFTFDSVADIRSTQEEIFQLVGLPLVENCLAGFNSSIFAYGQTGSGKTYTMWGPPNALSEHSLSSTNRGLTPRVFEMLFSRIDQEQSKHSDKKLSYQCRCSFLEASIYNEQITDLLDPTQRNLQVTNQTLSCFSWQSLLVFSKLADIVQVREDIKAGVYVDCLTEEFVCTIKDVNKLLMKGLANRRTGATSINVESSRSHCVFTCIIESRSKSPVDGLISLKTSRINLVDLAGSERQKLTGAAGERLKEAGNINRSLSQLGNLINVLAEVSQSGKQRHIPYRDSKLTFLLQESLGGNAKLVMICAISPSPSCKNETLSTLRFAQRAKAIKNKAVVNEVKQDDVNNLREQIRLLKDELQRMKSNGSSDNSGGYSTGWNARRSLHLLKMSLKPLPVVEDDSDEEMEIDDNDVEMPCVQLTDNTHDENNNSAENKQIRLADPCSTLSPTLSASPVADTRSRKSLRTSLAMSASQRKSCPKPTEDLAVSLQCGLQAIDNWQNSSVQRKSPFRFSVRPTGGKIITPINTVDVGIQACVQDLEELEDQANVCNYCKNNISELNNNDGNRSEKLQPVPVDGLMPTDRYKMQVPKTVESVLTGSIRREMALEDHSKKQAAEIMELKHLVEKYKHERDCNAMIAQTREDKIVRLESLMDGIMPTEEFMQEEFLALVNEHRVLKEKYENHAEILRLNIELKKVQDELDNCRNFFEMGERDVLMEEIRDLRSQLKYYIDSSESTQKPSSLFQLTHQGINSNPVTTASELADVRVDSMTPLIEELRSELEESRRLAEKLKHELDSEKKCAEELKEALQTAMQGHTRILEQYADLQEKHTNLLSRNQEISDELNCVMEATTENGVKEAEPKFINSLAAEISVLKAERERERRQWRDENKALKAQLRDTADALEAAGEVLVRLKEAEEAAAIAEKRALLAEQETEKANLEIERLKKNYDREIALHHQIPAVPNYDRENASPQQTPVESHSPRRLEHTEFHEGKSEQLSKEEFEPFCNRGGDAEFSMDTDPSSWFSGYDRCNI